MERGGSVGCIPYFCSRAPLNFCSRNQYIYLYAAKLGLRGVGIGEGKGFLSETLLASSRSSRYSVGYPSAAITSAALSSS